MTPERTPKVGDLVWVWDIVDPGWDPGVITEIRGTTLLGTFEPNGGFSFDIANYEDDWKYR